MLRYTPTIVGPVRVHIAHVDVSFLACTAIEGVISYDMVLGSIARSRPQVIRREQVSLAPAVA